MPRARTLLLPDPSPAVLLRPRIPDDGDTIVITGTRGTGKTTLGQRSLKRDVIRDGRKALVFDAVGDIEKYLVRGAATGDRISSRLVARVRSIEEAADAMRSRGFLVKERSPVRVLLIQPDASFSTRAARSLFVALASIREGWVLFADEAEQLWPLSLPQGPESDLLGMIRNKRQRLYAVTNYTQALAPRLRQLAQHACVFGGDSPRYVKGCEWFGDTSLFEPALGLEQFHYLHRAPGRARMGTPLPVRHAITGKLPW